MRRAFTLEIRTGPVCLSSAPLMAFTVLGPWEIPLSIYQQLDAMEVERVIPDTPMKRWLCDMGRRQLVQARRA